MASDPSTAATTSSSANTTTPNQTSSPSKPVASASQAASAAAGSVTAAVAPSSRTAPSSSAELGQAPHAPETTEGEKEKDKNSLNTSSLTATDARRAATKTESGAAGTATTAKPHSSSTNGRRNASVRPKKSLLSKIKGVLLSCVGPNAAHPIPDDEINVDPRSPKPAAQPKPTTTATPAPEPVQTTLTEKDPVSPAEETPVPATPVRSQPVSLDDATDKVLSPQPLAPEDVAAPPPPSDPEVVVPPSPTHTAPPKEETGGVLSGAVQVPGSTGGEIRDDESRLTTEGSMSESEEEEIEERQPSEDLEDDEDRLILNGGAGIPMGPDGVPRPLLPPVAPQHVGRKCLVLDLDETLVHSSFKSIQHADYVVPVEIEYHWHNVYVIKRPGVDNFLKKMGEQYEIVVFTASLSKYADPVLDKLDIHRVVTHRLFRESCYNHKGNYVKDLSQLGRPIADTIILDNSPASYIFHPNNAVPVSSWFNDPHDTELTDLVPFLADLTVVDDVRGILDGGL